MYGQQLLMMAMTEEPAALAGTPPVAFGPILREESEIVDQIFALVWDAQRICIGLFEAGGAVRPFPERPFARLLEPVLP